MRLLVVEDEFVGRRVLTRLLEPYGRVEVAVDGVEAIEAVKASLEEGEPYALICLDVMMPRLDGHGTLQQIRALEQERGLRLGRGAKIIMVSGLQDKETVLASFRGSGDAFLVKPVDPVKLVETLERLGLKPNAAGR